MLFYTSATVQNRFLREISSDKTYQYDYNRIYGNPQFFPLLTSVILTPKSIFDIKKANFDQKSCFSDFDCQILHIWWGFDIYLEQFYGILLSLETKKLPRFFRKKLYKFEILAKNHVFSTKTQNQYKKRVFRF